MSVVLKLQYILSAAAVFFIGAQMALAAQVEINSPIGATSLEDFVIALLGVVVEIGFPILILALVYSGFLFVKAQGKPEEIEKAKQAFFWTVVGGLVLLGAEVLAEAISGTIDQLKTS